MQSIHTPCSSPTISGFLCKGQPLHLTILAARPTPELTRYVLLSLRPMITAGFGVYRPRLEFNYPPPSSVVVMNGGSYTSNSSCIPLWCWQGQLYLSYCLQTTVPCIHGEVRKTFLERCNNVGRFASKSVAIGLLSYVTHVLFRRPRPHLAPYSRVLLHTLTVAHLIQKFPAFAAGRGAY